MIRALISGELVVTPLERTSKNGRPFALARASVPQSEGERVFCSVIAFQDEAVARLLQLKAGAAVSLAGTLKVSTWQAKDGTTRPALDLVADEVASTTPRPRKRNEQPVSQSGGDQFAEPSPDGYTRAARRAK